METLLMKPIDKLIDMYPERENIIRLLHSALWKTSKGKYICFNAKHRTRVVVTRDTIMYHLKNMMRNIESNGKLKDIKFVSTTRI